MVAPEGNPIPAKSPEYSRGSPVPIVTHRCISPEKGLSGGVVAWSLLTGKPAMAKCFDCETIQEVNPKALEIFEMVRIKIE